MMEETPKRIAEAIAAAERALGLDWRSSYSRIAFARAGSLSVELSREEVFGSLRDLLAGSAAAGAAGDEAGILYVDETPVRLRLLSPVTGRALWITSSVADIRREPAHSSELLTQLIMGETASLLKTEGDWHLVRLADDYHGWIRSWYARETDVGTITAYRARCTAIVDVNVGFVTSEPDGRSTPVADIVAGVAIPAGAPDRGFRRVELPGERFGFMRENDLVAPRPAGPPDRARIVERARRFIGIPYLWGGTSSKGFDCSGFVKRIFLMEGVSLPRDSDRQALVGSLLPRARLDESAPGDLLFFGEGGGVSHVGIHVGGRSFIHAYGEVRINSFVPSDPRHDPRLDRIFLFCRSVIA